MLFDILDMAETLVSYEPGKGYLHGWNPLTKLGLVVAVLGFGIYAASPSTSWYWGFMLFVAVYLLCMTGGVNIGKELAARKPYVIAIVLMFGLMNLFFGRGTQMGHVYFHIPPWFTVTSVSVHFAISKTFFLLSSLVSVIMLLKSTPLSDLTFSVNRIGVPYAVAMITATSVRCIPMVTNSLKITYNAQRARGLELDRGGFRERIRQIGSLLTPLMLILLKTVDLMSIVFQSRGLDLANRRRTHLRELPMRPLDWLVLASTLGTLAALVILVQLGVIHWHFEG
ncbi:MAG: energy-coupling factor transporter transmembrane component T [bacterium]|nr:energy-coupling factor transporter transmembrane component T [bacterium]